MVVVTDVKCWNDGIFAVDEEAYNMSLYWQTYDA